MSRERELDAWIDGLLADPQFHGHPLHQALARLRQQSLEQLVLERIPGSPTVSSRWRGSRTCRCPSATTSNCGAWKGGANLRPLPADDARPQPGAEGSLDPRPADRPAQPTHAAGAPQEENERSQRHGQSYVLAMLDVDFFKRVNDTWGHDSGDRVLVEIARAMESELRDTTSAAAGAARNSSCCCHRPACRTPARYSSGCATAYGPWRYASAPRR